ncbi:MAG: hypothetical protein DNFNHJIP_00316 [Candidatus Argoarchaeum ethanivorans]|uniref:VOC domain-containing protein n=1 Tax=Candidatus Argoarchaeum ethanivorans TaxID=2608793 RepID=A0A812A286_9EURY|nr:MAG: hypothetical protein DNFNHJIP_00316 [Candidatus Argoarchaeum ethanivorans]
MAMNKLAPNLMVEDVNRTVEFYKEVLGFEFVMGVIEEIQEVLTSYRKDRLLDYAMMKCGNVEIMFQAKRSLTAAIPALKDKEVGGTFTLYMELEGVSELYARVKDIVTVIKELHTTFYGMQEFYIKDCNGYILTFAEAA